jgi:hypothetical protein
MGQSLSEIAKKEKERRKQNEKKAGEVQVITESELQQVRRETPTSDVSTEANATSQSPRSPTTPSRRSTPAQAGDEAVEGGAPTEIPRDADIKEKIAIFEQMLKAHRLEAQRIDNEIAKNNTRIEEIQQELSTIGAGGLPVAPQVDNRVRYEGESRTLQAEQNELQQANLRLEAQKKRSADELRQKGRRAGIPAGYLRF